GCPQAPRPPEARRVQVATASSSSSSVHSASGFLREKEAPTTRVGRAGSGRPRRRSSPISGEDSQACSARSAWRRPQPATLPARSSRSSSFSRAMVWTTASLWPAYASGGASRRPGGISRLRERNSSARASMNGDAAGSGSPRAGLDIFFAGLGRSFGDGAAAGGFLRVEALLAPTGLADLLGGLIAP